MKFEQLHLLSTEQLVSHFTDLALAQDRAELEDRISDYNRLYDRMQLVRLELKNRDGDQRRALVALHRHSNAQVRLMSANSTLMLAPKASQAVLEELSKSRIFPQAANAGMMLEALASGRFVPT